MHRLDATRNSRALSGPPTGLLGDFDQGRANGERWAFVLAPGNRADSALSASDFSGDLNLGLPRAQQVVYEVLKVHSVSK